MIQRRAVNRRAAGLKTTLLVSSDLITWTPHPIQAHTLRETLSHRWERISLPQLGAQTFYRLEGALDSDSRPAGSFRASEVRPYSTQ